MSRHGQRLNKRQVEVLHWIAAGCPEGVWKDFSYEVRAYALQDRGLAKVDRRRHQWAAEVTEDGRYYLRLHHHGFSLQRLVEVECRRVLYRDRPHREAK